MKRIISIALTILLILISMNGCKSDMLVNVKDADIASEKPHAISNNTLNNSEKKDDNPEITKIISNEVEEKFDEMQIASNNKIEEKNEDTQMASNEITNPKDIVLNENKDEVKEMRDITTMQVVREMGLGINLGNTFEACGDWINTSKIQNYETAWGSPVITEDMIKGYAAAGFGVLRIPVAWSNMMSQDGTYTINPELFNRVKQVVDWAMNSGLYVIINLHWDNGWMQEFPDKKAECMEKYSLIWTQVSEVFKDYNDYLIFESQNEELGWESIWNRWAGNKGKEESYILVNEINQKFVDTVRASGGNNNLRHLLIAGYNTDIDLTCDSLYIVPTDSVNRCAVSVHYYTPSTLTIIDKDVSWGKARTTWGSDTDIKELENKVQMIKTRFIDKGIPVIVGEYGCFGSNKTRETINHYLATVSKAFYDAEACPILWNTPNDQYNRLKAEFTDKELLDQLLSALE